MDIQLDLRFVPDQVRTLLVKYIELEQFVTDIGKGKTFEKEREMTENQTRLQVRLSAYILIN